MGAVVAVDTAQMPVLHFGEVQSGGVAALRWAACSFLAAPGAVPVLLAAVLLGVAARSTGGMKLSLPAGAGSGPEWLRCCCYSGGPTVITRYVTGAVLLALAM